MLKDLNVKYPHIVLAQSILETGHYSSTIFKTNHNLFGMKEARRRVKTAKGTQLNHAYYENWKESVYDYAFYQCRYMGRIDSEDEYYQALDASYAEANQYSTLLKQIVERENLHSLFK
jgi:flagellum-specific peptidoglycan hydrolase FlgJ